MRAPRTSTQSTWPARWSRRSGTDTRRRRARLVRVRVRVRVRGTVRVTVRVTVRMKGAPHEAGAGLRPSSDSTNSSHAALTSDFVRNGEVLATLVRTSTFAKRSRSSSPSTSSPSWSRTSSVRVRVGVRVSVRVGVRVRVKV